MKIFDRIVVALIAIILGLLFWIHRLYQNNDNSVLEDLHKSKGRVEILERKLKSETLKGDSLAMLRDSIINLQMADHFLMQF